MENRNVIIRSRKYDGQIHRTWQAKLVSRGDSWLQFEGRFEQEIKHPQLGVISRDTISYEFYRLDCWYNIFRFHEPDGSFRNFYCNVNTPPTLVGDVLEYIDLDIDVLVWKDFSYQILDLDEFTANAQKYSYPNELQSKAKTVLHELISMIEARTFPFDYKF